MVSRQVRRSTVHRGLLMSSEAAEGIGVGICRLQSYEWPAWRRCVRLPYQSHNSPRRFPHLFEFHFLTVFRELQVLKWEFCILNCPQPGFWKKRISENRTVWCSIFENSGIRRLGLSRAPGVWKVGLSKKRGFWKPGLVKRGSSKSGLSKTQAFKNLTFW